MNDSNGKFRPHVWNDELSLSLLEQLAIKQKDLESPLKHSVYEEIAKESFPNHTATQCKCRMTKMLATFRHQRMGYLRIPPSGCSLSPKVLAKLNEMWPNGRKENVPLKTKIVPKKEHARRIFTNEIDVLLLDGIMKRKLGGDFFIKDSSFQEIIDESLPQLTVVQCRNRLLRLRKLFHKNLPGKYYSKEVHDKLTLLHKQRSANGAVGSLPKKCVRIWDEENDLRMLDAIMELRPGLNETIPMDFWYQLVEETMPSKYSAEQCKCRYKKMILGYKTRQERGEFIRVNLTPKVYATLCSMFGGNIESQEPDICRCCGQITDDLIDLTGEANMMEWFLSFTGLTGEQVKTPFTKICQICGDKLSQARQFREQCLMGAQVIQTEIAFVPNEPQATQQTELEEKPPQCCSICGEIVPWAKYTQHRRTHYIAKFNETAPEETCKFCGKTFRNSRRLAAHLKYHADGNIYECKHCPKKCLSKGDLRSHIYKHHTKEPDRHLCNTCGKVFAAEVDLKHHVNTHIGLKQYKCPHCDQRFARSHGMNNHIKSLHENISHPCPECGVKYKQTGKLKFHVLLQHKGAFLRCDECNLESKSVKNFKVHLKYAHSRMFDQSVHMILGNGERLLKRKRRIYNSLIQTEKIDGDSKPETVEEEFIIEEAVEDDDAGAIEMSID